MAVGATWQNDLNTKSPTYYERIIEKTAKEKGITEEEAKAQMETRLKEIAEKKGITVEELKKQMAEGKFKGKCRPGHGGQFDEAKLKEIAEKKGITVEELKQRLKQRQDAKE
jgi:predicted DsbA family dithiol-disulfide isomerase